MKTKPIIKKIVELRNISITTAAKELKVSRQHLSGVINGKTPCGRKLALKIEKWSGGLLSASKLMGL